MLSEQNVEAELSYAYLHAVATRGGFSCSYAHRHLNAGEMASLPVVRAIVGPVCRTGPRLWRAKVPSGRRDLQ